MTTLVQASAVGAGIAMLATIFVMEKHKSRKVKAVEVAKNTSGFETRRGHKIDDAVIQRLKNTHNAHELAMLLDVGGDTQRQHDAAAFAAAPHNEPNGHVTQRDEKIVQYGSFEPLALNVANQRYRLNVPPVPL